MKLYEAYFKSHSDDVTKVCSELLEKSLINHTGLSKERLDTLQTVIDELQLLKTQLKGYIKIDG